MMMKTMTVIVMVMVGEGREGLTLGSFFGDLNEAVRSVVHSQDRENRNTESQI